MAFFKAKKNDNRPESKGKSSAHALAESSKTSSINSVKILGSGCTNCNMLESAARKALQELQLDVPIEHVTDFTEIAAYGVMSTPALVVNEQVLAFGRVLKQKEIIALLKPFI